MRNAECGIKFVLVLVLVIDSKSFIFIVSECRKAACVAPKKIEERVVVPALCLR